MTIELLWWEGCPSHPEALAELRRVLADEHVDDPVRLVEIETDEQARAERFPGSPTIRIDGEDIQPPGDAPIGLSCRVYRRRDGSISPLPDPTDVRAALDRGGRGGGANG